MVWVILLTAVKPRSGMNSEIGQQDRPLQKADWTESCGKESASHLEGEHSRQRDPLEQKSKGYVAGEQ